MYAYKTWKPDSKVSDTSFFHSMVKHMDIEVGRILNELKEKGLDKNTIVIFAGDNGTPFQIYYDVDENSDIEGEKRATTEGGTHVPLVVYWPSHIQAAQKNDDLIDFTDFLSTFAEIGGIKDLSGYGKVDGLSFYNRMLGVEDASKKQLFMHYCAHPGFDKLQRWVRDKSYKLYDSSKGGKFRFYNIIDDEKELKPLDDGNLTNNEKAIKKQFKHILDSIVIWKSAPSLNQVFVKNITSNSAVIGATVADAGYSPLIDRGSNIIGSALIPTLGQHRKRDSVVSLGSFSQLRVDLAAETAYGFSIYAMNQNESNSTGYIRGKFFTLSTAPVLQPSYFKACADSSSVFLSWSHAVFPLSGAKLRGYAVFYSTEQIVISPDPNGNSPATVTRNATLLYASANNNPSKLDTNAGAGELIDRGSTIIKKGSNIHPYIPNNIIHDSLITLGTFSEKVDGLLGETFIFILIICNEQRFQSQYWLCC